ncbi:MBL fold metallo-hydrolase [Falsibacillus albus]|uniref:MBL fold metallo-hydrolase n=1 Tax=Falsibacillus albus TaxID=2478915 RepID=A0A3L7JSC2_9BACI|nr:MBL fold metallo-hydrolase [Falsibacillus albus]RLQ93214.1 MBL fold metallo-hydrolase [Falsibacillus albus]
MKIADGIEMLEISANMMGKTETIHPVLIWNENEALLVDTGFPGQLPLFKNAFLKAEVPFEKLKKIIITHQDIDHIGSLPAILRASPEKIDVYSSKGEKPFIQGDKRILKITPDAIAQVKASLPSSIPEEWKKAFIATLENPPKAQVDHTLSGGEQVPSFGEVRVIDTPGHTPAHISLYHQPSKTVIAGDAMMVKNGDLQPPDPHVTLDLKAANNSIKRLIKFPEEIERVICYHGGLFEGNVKARMQEIVDAFK